MQEPKISWFVRRADSDSFSKESEFYAGTYNKKDNLDLVIQIWNNRYGTTAVKDLQDFGLTVSFDDEEDSVLLKYMRFTYGMTILTPQIIGNQAVIKLPEDVVLSGALNDGSEESEENFISMSLAIILPKNIKVKLNDLKSMTLSVAKM